MIPVVIESPFAAHARPGLAKRIAPRSVESWLEDRQRLHVNYARACLADCLSRGEAPLASHLLYTQPGVLDDTVPGERKKGIEASFVWRIFARATVVYTDFGISTGMQQGIDHACDVRRVGSLHAVIYRTLPGWQDAAREVR